jgi:hypothetical protein
LQGIAASRHQQEQLLGVLQGEEEAGVREAHVEQEAQVEVEAHME